MFNQGFGKFACEGDMIQCEHDGFTVIATIHSDQDCETPEQRGETEPAVIDAWLKNRWFYCAVALTVYRNGVQLTGKYDHALWGVECNYPGDNNEYLRVVANEMLDDAIANAKNKIKQLSA